MERHQRKPTLNPAAPPMQKTAKCRGPVALKLPNCGIQHPNAATYPWAFGLNPLPTAPAGRPNHSPSLKRILSTSNEGSRHAALCAAAASARAADASSGGPPDRLAPGPAVASAVEAAPQALDAATAVAAWKRVAPSVSSPVCCWRSHICARS
ncbi:hypothetical protein Vafri_254 [Volvox africanus]|nr:hypothetical protein Vafri_254 [Volvox africanus]